MKTVTDTFTVQVTQVYETDDEETLMTEKDYETLFENLFEISGGLIDSFDDAKVTKLKHFIEETDSE